MKRKIINIDEEKCNGCGLCIPACHEGALQVIDGKIRLISDLFCDGLGACIGFCPEDAITIEEREAEPYDEIRVMETIVPKGRNTILAHLEHLRDHNEQEYLSQAINYIKVNNIDMGEERLFPPIVAEPVVVRAANHPVETSSPCGCPGSLPKDFRIEPQVGATVAPEQILSAASELRQWPVQLHLLNPMASYFKGANVILTADCVAFAMGDFHQKFLKGRSLAIACPKLDSNKESYISKLTAMISEAKVNSLSVIIMEVPCCGGLVQMARMARDAAGSKMPIKTTVISIKGEILEEEMI